MKTFKKSFGLMGALSFTLLAASLAGAAASDTIRVDCGNTSNYVDSRGRTWVADSGYVNGQVYTATSTITGSSDPALHQTERWDSQTFTYTFNVTPGSYRVSLYEASLYASVCNAGGRVFDVAINGTTVMSNYDMYTEIGACLKEQIKRFVVVTATGQIKIDFMVGSASNPKINAIEIIPGTSTPVLDAVQANGSKLSVSSANGGLLVQSRTEGAYSLELSNLQGQRIGLKHGYGFGSQSFANLNPGLYFLTSRIGNETTTRKVSVVR